MTGPRQRTVTNNRIERLCAAHQFSHDPAATAELVRLLRDHPDDVRIAAARSHFIRNITTELRLDLAEELAANG